MSASVFTLIMIPQGLNIIYLPLA